MKNLIITVVLLINALISIAQVNLVPNGGFEVYSNCPDYLDEVDRATGWFSVHPSPDYFNSCAPSTATGQAKVNVPNTFFGYQYAHSGNAFAGMSTFNLSVSAAKEAIGTELNNPLQAGTNYYVSFWINLYNSQQNSCAANKIGAFFSSKLYSSTDTVPIQNQSQIFTDSIVTDTLNWIEIKKSFTADSNYKYMYVGNFFKNGNTDYLALHGTGPNYVAYYYVDDICVSLDSVYCDIWTKVNTLNITQNELTVSPNPFTDYFIINKSFENIKKIELVDIHGNKQDFQIEILENNIKVRTENIMSGLYFLNLTLSNKVVYYKIIHQ